MQHASADSIQSKPFFFFPSSFNSSHLSRQVLKLLGDCLPNELYTTEYIDIDFSRQCVELQPEH